MKRKTTPLEQACFEYLNDLRDLGQTNMFGARPYIVREFELGKQEAGNLLSLWMKNFNQEGKYDEIEVEQITKS